MRYGTGRMVAWAGWLGITAAVSPDLQAAEGAEARPGFTRLAALSAVKIVANTEQYPGDRYQPAHLLDGNPDTEFAFQGHESAPFVEFDLGRSVAVAAYQHLDRKDPATVGAATLEFLDEGGAIKSTVLIPHANQMGGSTRFHLPAPVTARRVRWRVTGLGAHRLQTIGGREITFFSVEGADSAPTAMRLSARVVPLARRENGRIVRPVRLLVDYPYAQEVEATLGAEGAAPVKAKLGLGSQTVELSAPATDIERTVRIHVEVAGRPVAQHDFTLQPLPGSVIYILPHSHVDIGYTALQTEIERKQIANIDKGIEIARATADYPEGARYRWNVEVLWAVESYLRQSPEHKQKFIDAVKKGWIGLDAMYGNELTGLCRPEELLRVFTYAHTIGELCGVAIDSAMISDVPGYTWGTLSAMQQSGVKYWSIGPNYFDRMGFTIVTWENKPFWWVAPDGRHKVLCWVPYQGYAMSHLLRTAPTPAFVTELMTRLEEKRYPYDMICIRWSGYTDNAEPDEKIPDFVKEWNEQYVSPRFVISTTHEAFSEMEKRYGDRLPEFKGDWTPYWEDGAGSSAAETALSRNAADRLSQAETLFAMRNPAGFPAGDFHKAWRNVMLYSEHTWGAHNSVTEPEIQFVKEQWKIKQAFAVDAGRQSVELLRQSLAAPASAGRNAIDVFNTSSWPRSELVTVSKELSAAGDRVTDAAGRPVPSQRLSTGELVFMAEPVPPFGASRYAIGAGQPVQEGSAQVHLPTRLIQSDSVRVWLDAKTGAIVDLRKPGAGQKNLADSGTIALNDFFFVPGSQSGNPLRAGPVKITVKEKGPLVASLLVESDAPGCHKLTREIRVVAGKDHVEILNTIDKKRIEVQPKPGDWNYAGTQTKEGLHFGFAFNVPDGVMRVDIPWAVARPEADQIPGACKNWFSVNRWVDVSNDDCGVTWVTLDAPLVEVGAITANLLGSQTNPDVWISRLEPTQTFYSWVMNNHWHTNYRAYQEGEVTFRYAVRPHAGYDPAEATRFATGLSQPLVAVAADVALPAGPRLTVDSKDVVVTAFKPSDDGRACIVRLFGAAGKDAEVTLNWSDPKPTSVALSNAGEKPLAPVAGRVKVPAWGIVTLRAERP